MKIKYILSSLVIIFVTILSTFATDEKIGDYLGGHIQDDQYVYYQGGGSGGGGGPLYRVFKGGGSPEQITQTGKQVKLFIIDGNILYYTNYGENNLYKIYKDGSNKNSPDIIGNGIVIGGGNFLVQDTEYLYYLYTGTNNSATIGRIKKSDNTNMIIFNDIQSCSKGLIGDYFYFDMCGYGTYGDVFRVSKDGIGGKVFIGIRSHYGIMIDNNYLYYERRTSDPNPGTIYRVNLNNSTDHTQVTSDKIKTRSQFKIHNGYIYYIRDVDLFIYRVKIDGSNGTIGEKFSDTAVSTYYWGDAKAIDLLGEYLYYISGEAIYRKNMLTLSGAEKMTGSNPVYTFVQDIYDIFYKDGINWERDLWKVSKTPSPVGNSNGNFSHYILNRLTATEGNMQQVNNFAGSTSFSNSSQVKANFLANYSYMQSWYEAKGLTMDVINNNVDWDNGVTFSKTDVANGMLDGYKLSAHYPFMSYKETDNHDSSIFWRTNLENTSFQSDTTWAIGVPAYPIRNGSGGIVAYLEYPCGNLICKDQYCSDVKKIITQNPINPIAETVFSDPGNGDGWCGDGIKNTMEEECDGNDGIRHDLGESCNAQCKVVIGGNTPGCPSYSGLGYKCDGTTPTPIFSIVINQPPVPTYSGFGVSKNSTKNDTLTATDTENDTLTFAKFSDPAHGTVNVLPNGSFTYTPNLNYTGNDSFFYSVSDGTNPAVTQEVSVVINDVVVGNNPPVPTFTTFSVAKNSTKNDTLTATDTENDTLSFISISTTIHGDLVINNDGTFTYTPNIDYSGTDTFTYAVSDGHNLPVNHIVTIRVNNIGDVINWTPPGGVTLPNIGDINTNTGMTDDEKKIADDVVCSVLEEGFKVSKSIIVTNTMADTSLISRLKGKDEFLKTLSGSSSDVADKIIGKKIKTSKLNEKSSTYDFGSGGTISGIQFNLSEIPDSAVIRKLVDLAIDHSSTTMADYEQTVKDSCNNSSIVTGKEVVPAGFIDVNEKGQTILNLFRFNGY